MGYQLTGRISRRDSFFRGVATLVLAAFLLGPGAFPRPALAAWGDFSIADEVELGRQIRMSIRSTMPIADGPDVTRYADRLLERLSAGVPPQPFPLSINVVRHNAINAFAAPGGNLFLFTGLILAMDTESELAGVLAHELAHATQRHIAARIKQMNVMSLLSLAGMLAGAFIGGDAGPALMAGTLAAGQTSLLYNSRSDESDADQVGMQYLLAAGFAPQGMVGAFDKIRRQQWLLGLDIPTYLSTHPDVADRISTLTNSINGMSAALRARQDDNREFFRVQALIRGYYADPDMALAVFAGQKDGPRRCLSFMGEGIVYSRQNKVAQARAAFEEALACGGDDALIIREAGVFHYLKGDQGQGAELIRRAVALDRGDLLALFFQGRVLLDAGQALDAANAFRDVLRQAPDDPEVHYYYAQALGQSKQLFSAHLHLAYSAMYAGDRQKMENSLAQAKGLAQSPADEEALKRFENILKERRAVLGG